MNAVSSSGVKSAKVNDLGSEPLSNLLKNAVVSSASSSGGAGIGGGSPADIRSNPARINRSRIT
jgi:hypothetical protein